VRKRRRRAARDLSAIEDSPHWLGRSLRVLTGNGPDDGLEDFGCESGVVPSRLSDEAEITWDPTLSGKPVIVVVRGSESSGGDVKVSWRTSDWWALS